MSEAPYIVDLMRPGDIIEHRYVVWASDESTVRSKILSYLLQHPQIYSPLLHTLVVEPLRIDDGIAKVW
jgi:hypothetical protein